MNDRSDKIILNFKKDNGYRMCSYVFKHRADSNIFSYHLLDGKFEDAKGKVLKKEKIKERGTYQLKEKVIEFAAADKKYSQLYQLQGKVLVLTQFDQAVPSADLYVIKFKRVQ